MDKDLLRKKYLFQRQQNSLKSVSLMSETIINKIIESAFYKNAKTIFTYVSVKNEVDTFLLILKAFEDNKKIAVPKTYNNGIMKFYYIQSIEDLKVSRFGLLEPINTDDEAIPEETTLFLVPGVVFDYSGNRIGYGAGYYDKYLNKLSYVTKIGLAFDNQVLEDIPSDEYDVKMNLIITEQLEYPRMKN